MYSKHDFGILLKEQLHLHPYDPDTLAMWGERIRNNFTTGEIREIAGNISAMSCGPEFVYTKEELEFLANKLIMGEENAWDQMIQARPLKITHFSKIWLGNELLKQLSTSDYDEGKTALWAENMLLCYRSELSKDLIDILEVLSWMKKEPNLIFSKKQLNFLATELISDNDKALEQMSEII